MKFRTLVICFLIAISVAGVGLHGQGSLEIRAASSTPVAGWAQMSTPQGDRLWVSPASTLTSADIARAESRAQPDGQRAVGVIFTDDGSRKMAQLSTAQINKPIAMLLDGTVVWAPVVRSAITTEAMLTGVTPDVLERVLIAIKK